jgi:hypothetical protein
MRLRYAALFLLVPCALFACGDDAATPDSGDGIPDSGFPRFDAGRDATLSPDASDAAPSDAAGDAVAQDAPRADGEGGSAITPPVADGTISPGEYGVHADGQNQQTSDVDAANRSTWYMTWDDVYLYVGITFANVTEGAVLYIDTDPPQTFDGGTNADGTRVGFGYDTVVANLPMRADFVAYLKSTYNDYRRADGAGGWSAQTVAQMTQVGSGSTREIVIPWTAIRTQGRPPSFAWAGYVVSNSSQYVYSEMPPDNPGGSVGDGGASASFTLTHVYRVDNATPGTGTKPFANKLVP